MWSYKTQIIALLQNTNNSFVHFRWTPITESMNFVMINIFFSHRCLFTLIWKRQRYWRGHICYLFSEGPECGIGLQARFDEGGVWPGVGSGGIASSIVNGSSVHSGWSRVAYLHLENGKVPVYSANPWIGRLHTQFKIKYHNKVSIITRGSST